MNLAEFFTYKQNQYYLIKIAKILLIGFVSFSLLASAIPFYLGYDDVNYGLNTINLSKGSYGITNEIFQETGDEQFIPRTYVKTIQDEAIPKTNVGIYTIGAIFYLIGGFYSLFYFGPLITIVLLIVFERITTKFFGNMIGLLALLLLVGEWQFYFVGLRFLTDNIFSLFFILGIFSLIKFFYNKNDKYIFLSSTFFVISTFFRINGIVFFPTEILVILGFFIVRYLKDVNLTNKNKSQIILIKKLFSKSNSRKFFKTSFLLILPWLIFFTFWISYNDYYFGDATTNYREQVIRGSINSEDSESTSILNIPISAENNNRNEFERLNLVKYFSIPLLPDPLYFFLIISTDTDLEVWRGDIWVSYITFFLLALSSFFSIYFKIKRKEVLTLIFFIIILVGFHSSPFLLPDPFAENLSEHANSRYMIPVSLLSFILIGFILVEIWHKFPQKDYVLAHKIFNPLKFIYLILIVIFFLVLVAVMPSIQDIYQNGFHFNNPSQYSKSFEELEKLPPKSLLVGYISRETLLHTDTHFFPYGPKFITEDGNPKFIPENKIETLTELLDQGYGAYVLKRNMFSYDEKYFKFLEAEHGIILQDYSKTFCKLDSISEFNNFTSDPNCFKDVIENEKKIWDVTLKWP